MSIKMKLLSVGKTQVDLIVELRERGVICNPSELSKSINGVLCTPKSEKILDETLKIISDWQGEKTDAENESYS